MDEERGGGGSGGRRKEKKGGMRNVSRIRQCCPGLLSPFLGLSKVSQGYLSYPIP